MSLTLITLSATYETLSGAPCLGTVTFVLSAPLQDAAGNVIYPVIPVTVTLDGNGALSLPLPATNDPTTQPTGLTYKVTESITGANGNQPRSYSIELDHAGGPQDLADLAPSTDVAVNTYVPLSTYNSQLSAFDLQVGIVAGAATVQNNTYPPGVEATYATTLTTLKVRVGTAPVGSGLTVRFNVDGVSIGTVTVAAGTTSNTATISHAIVSGAILTWDITAIGSSTAGSDVAVRMIGI